MQLILSNIKSWSLAAYHSLFSGRIARTTFAIRVTVLSAVTVLLATPLSSYLAPSSQTLKDAYLFFALSVLAICLLGFVSAYVKRLHDMGLRGYWAILLIGGLPFVIMQAGYSYTNYRYGRDKFADLSGVYDILFVACLALPLLIAMWRGDKGENQFGSAPPLVENIIGSKLIVTSLIAAGVTIIPTSIYAGLFQSGVWVGRGNSAPPAPWMDSNASGLPFMKCWNLRGVGAGSGEGTGSGVYRDGYEGNAFDFLVTPDGQFDVAMVGPRAGKSFLADGFRIVPYGLKFPADGSQYVNVRGMDRFMLVAIFDEPGEAVNYTSFTFGRNKGIWPQYHVILTTSLSTSSKAATLLGSPEARGRLMIGDCMPR